MNNLDTKLKFAFVALVVSLFSGVGGYVFYREVIKEENPTNNEQLETDNSSSTTDIDSTKVFGFIQQSPSFTKFAEALKETDLLEKLDKEGAQYTVFAPSNEAFKDAELPTDKTQLTKLLEYHIVETQLLAQNLTPGNEITTLSGESFKVTISEERYFLIGKNNQAYVLETDKKLTNGVIHTIDGVLIP